MVYPCNVVPDRPTAETVDILVVVLIIYIHEFYTINYII